MSPERLRNLQRLVKQAADLSAGKRTALVRQVFESDPELGRDLEAMLGAGDAETLPLTGQSARGSTRDRLFHEGQVILNRFQILSFLGAGGMGEVYQALDREMGRVALKTLRRDVSSNAKLLERLKGEVRLARQIASPYVCRLYEFFPIPAQGGSPELACFTMEFLDGCTLSQYIREKGALAWKEAKPIILQICEGLKAIHRAGVIHRDLKSGNIMLVERDGRTEAVVMDFGLAQRPLAMAAGAAAGGRVLIGAAAGTPAYMAPEQFQGEELTAATDIYAFGVVLYEMLSAKHPFHAAIPFEAAGRGSRPLQPLAPVRKDVPPEIDRIIGRCLEFEPSRRFQSADEVMSALAPEQFDLAGFGTLLLASVWRRRFAAALLLLAIVAAVVLLRPPVYRPGVSALDWYNKGVSALQQGAYVTATNMLQKAVDHAPDFVLAHARLAEAWSELDFTGKAEHEMLLASTIRSKGRLTKLDAEYLQAIQQYVTEDFPGAVLTYKRILWDLPAGERATGYLDLGRAEERAGDVDGALQQYSEAARAPLESPASLLRRAILESREDQVAASDRDFAQAARLYRQAGNAEGIAEVDYQRSIGASNRGQSAQASTLAERSLHASEQIGSLQLQIRALVRLAVIAYADGKDDQAIDLAKKAIDLARDKGLDYWAIDARVRLANAYVDRGDFDRANAELNEALVLAQEAKVSRLLALTNLSLAALRNLQHDSDATIAFASHALDYYRRERFDGESLQCLTLIGRAKDDKGEFRSALTSGLEALQLAKSTKNAATIYPVEELIGTALLDLQDYPSALEHFEAATRASRQAGQQVDFEVLHCADTLWRLGRYEEAYRLIDSVPSEALKQPDLRSRRSAILAELNVSLQNYQKAVLWARASLRDAGQVGPLDQVEAELLLMEALAGLGRNRAAMDAFDSAEKLAAKLNGTSRKAPLQSVAAELLLSEGSLKEAREQAASALVFFSASGQREWEIRTRCTLGSIAKRMGDEEASRDYGRKGLDMLSGFAHNWGSDAYSRYVSRTDLKDLAKRLSVLAGRSM